MGKVHTIFFYLKSSGAWSPSPGRRLAARPLCPGWRAQAGSRLAAALLPHQLFIAFCLCRNIFMTPFAQGTLRLRGRWAWARLRRRSEPGPRVLRHQHGQRTPALCRGHFPVACGPWMLCRLVRVGRISSSVWHAPRFQRLHPWEPPHWAGPWCLCAQALGLVGAQDGPGPRLGASARSAPPCPGPLTLHQAGSPASLGGCRGGRDPLWEPGWGVTSPTRGAPVRSVAPHRRLCWEDPWGPHTARPRWQ